MIKFEELSDEEKEFYYQKASEFLNGRELLYCNRSWSAWSHGTMSENDFHPVDEDDNVIAELAEHIYDIVKVKVRKNKIKNILDVS
jgi:hypothetical protein